MRLQRQQVKRGQGRSNGLMGCVTIFIALIGILLAGGLFLVPRLPQIALRAGGFESLGDTEQVVEQMAAESAVVAAAPAITGNQNVSSALIVDAGPLGRRSLTTNSPSVAIQIGQSAGGTALMQASVNEDDLLDLCKQYSPYCQANGTPLRNATVDLRPGGLIIRGEFLVPTLNIWQRAGVVIRLRDGSNRVEVTGVDLDGQLFAAPPDGFGELVVEMEQTANQVLQQLTVQAEGQSFRLDNIFIDDATATMTLR